MARAWRACRAPSPRLVLPRSVHSMQRFDAGMAGFSVRLSPGCCVRTSSPAATGSKARPCAAISCLQLSRLRAASDSTHFCTTLQCTSALLHCPTFFLATRFARLCCVAPRAFLVSQCISRKPGQVLSTGRVVQFPQWHAGWCRREIIAVQARACALVAGQQECVKCRESCCSESTVLREMLKAWSTCM